MGGQFAIALLLLVVTGACAQLPTSNSQARADAGATAPPQRLTGYLQPHERPDSLALLPAPPDQGSSGFALDVEIHRATRVLRDTPRWQLAVDDANVSFPFAARHFSCALGVAITPITTPRLYVLLQRAMIDAGQSTAAAKDHYQRPRPVAVYDEPACTPDLTSSQRASPSYPSGHAAAGWAWALILTEIAPERATQLLRRGHEFGQSRVVCGMHWQSDVDTGRTIAAAAVARLHANAEFVADVTAARREVERARTGSHPPPEDCASEALALGYDGAR